MKEQCCYGCGKEYNYIFKDGRKCCSRSPNSCQIKKSKNSKELNKDSKIICSYGCENIAKFELKNGKFCCERLASMCSINSRPKKIPKNVLILNNDLEFICDYGCNQQAKYRLPNKKNCCSFSQNSCSAKKKRKIIKVDHPKTEFCENGCGQKVVHQVKNNGKWICNKDHRKCPVNRLKYGHGKNLGRKASDETKIKIGLKSREKRGFYKQETIELFRKRMTGAGNPRYGKTFKHKEESKIKFRKTMENLGYWNKLEDLTEFERYKREVYKYTNISSGEKYTKEELKNRGRLKDKHIHIDHIFSIIKGFKLKINPKIIGSKSNIRILTVTENCSKQSKCEITLEELFRKYEDEIKNEDVESRT